MEGEFASWYISVQNRVLSVADSFMRSRRVRILTFENPCDWRMLRNSGVSIIILKKEILKEVNDAYHFKTERTVYHE